ncbi:MAG TPA: pyridoxamine 5'-phosphate oxidase [Chitinophagaceae bacterium]|jgi:pyridoxamine 5'-phosphate oxidase
MKKEIADIRKDYMLQTLDESNVEEDAISQFTKWWNEAVNSAIDEVNAMTLATVSKEGAPSARIVLLKDYDERGFVFFTNYNSQKSNELEINPHAALVFFWKELDRQIRIQGVTEKINSEESDIYFFSRPIGSRIGAWASPQSAVIDSRKMLEEKVKLYTEQFGGNVPRPPYWGGYRVIPFLIEFWQGRSNRLHDRIRYSKNGDISWRIERLAP